GGGESQVHACKAGDQEIDRRQGDVAYFLRPREPKYQQCSPGALLFWLPSLDSPAHRPSNSLNSRRRKPHRLANQPLTSQSKKIARSAQVPYKIAKKQTRSW